MVMYYGNQDKLRQFAGGAEIITDDHPRTEYFLIRQIFKTYPDMDYTYLP